MTCTPQQHVCEWAESADQVERILARCLAGTPPQALATEYGVAVAEISAICEDHGLPLRHDGLARGRIGVGPDGCGNGVHTCSWSDRADVVEDLVDGYAQGRSINELSKLFPYSRATVTRILDAHEVPRRSRSEQCTRVQLPIQEIEQALADGVTMKTIAARHQLSRQMLLRRLNQARAAA
ncbi:hypothetical protein [Streptacidiphilus rugosus]|uniref:hypothetical protein n=1 Tax=Streptacidiphilus rugosus TaxID=405783 RepID=UPI00055FD418|nr:hypothetical protein [Streptacidiphilus rugosus]